MSRGGQLDPTAAAAAPMTTLVAWSSRRLPPWFARWVATLRAVPQVMWLDVDQVPGPHDGPRKQAWWQTAHETLKPGTPAGRGAVMVWQAQEGGRGWATLQGSHAWRWLFQWQQDLVARRLLPQAMWSWADVPDALKTDVAPPPDPSSAAARVAAVGTGPAYLTPLPVRPDATVQGAVRQDVRPAQIPLGSLAASRLAGRIHPYDIYNVPPNQPTGSEDDAVVVTGGERVHHDAGGGEEEPSAAAEEAPGTGTEEAPPPSDDHAAAGGEGISSSTSGISSNSASMSAVASTLLGAIQQELAAVGAGTGAWLKAGTGAGSASGAGGGGAATGGAQRPMGATFSIHVDSRDRNLALYPTPSNYKIALKETIRKVRAVNLTSIVVPNTEQVIRSQPPKIRNNRFYWSTRERYPVVELGLNPFTTTRDSKTVVVTDPGHGFPSADENNAPIQVCFYVPGPAGGVDASVWVGPFALTRIDPQSYSVPLSVACTFTGATGGAGVRRFRVVENSFSVELDPGFYDPSSFKDQFLAHVNQERRQDPVALVSDYHSFDMDMDTNTNTVKIRNMSKHNLAAPFSVQFNSSIVRVTFPDHNMVPGDRLRITKTNPFGNIPTSKFNETFTVLPTNFTSNQFEIDVSVKSNETNGAAGGTGVQIAKLLWFSMSLDTSVVSDSFGPLIGFGSSYPRVFAPEHVNLDATGAPLSSIQLSGENYILMQIPTFDRGLRQQSTSAANRAFAVLQLSLPPGSIIYNQFISPTVVFAPEPLEQLTEIEVRMVKGNGDYFFFNNIDHSFTLEVMYEQFNK